MDNLSTGKIGNLNIQNPNFRLLKGDILNAGVVREALKDVERVFHLAAIVDVPSSVNNPVLVNEINISGASSVLNESIKKVEKFIYASSCAVYGEPIYLPIDENHPTSPLSPYAVSKLAVEKYCQVFSKLYGLETVCLRLFNVYGLRQSFSYAGVISRFIHHLRLGKPPVIFGNGLQTRDFVYVEDVVDAMFESLRLKRCRGEKINIGSGVETSIRKLAETLIKKLGLENVKPKYVKPRVGDIKRSWANIEKARRLLKYEPRFSLEDGLEEFLKNFLFSAILKAIHI